MVSVSGKIDCIPETLRKWVHDAQRDTGPRASLSKDERQRMKQLEWEVRELKQANEILRRASAFFVQAQI